MCIEIQTSALHQKDIIEGKHSARWNISLLYYKAAGCSDQLAVVSDEVWAFWYCMAPWVGIGGIGLVVGREWENFMPLSLHGFFRWESGGFV